jgi:hypothetical protein
MLCHSSSSGVRDPQRHKRHRQRQRQGPGPPDFGGVTGDPAGCAPGTAVNTHLPARSELPKCVTFNSRNLGARLHPHFTEMNVRLWSGKAHLGSSQLGALNPGVLVPETRPGKLGTSRDFRELDMPRHTLPGPAVCTPVPVPTLLLRGLR